MKWAQTNAIQNWPIRVEVRRGDSMTSLPHLNLGNLCTSVVYICGGERAENQSVWKVSSFRDKKFRTEKAQVCMAIKSPLTTCSENRVGTYHISGWRMVGIAGAQLFYMASFP